MVGTSGSGVAAPVNDPSWEIWGVSARGSYLTRATRWFEIHRLDGEPADWANRWRDHLRGDKAIEALYMMYPEPDLLPGRVLEYPRERIEWRFGSFFMQSTFSWMVALAIDEMCPMVGGRSTLAEPGSQIFMCGVDLEYGTEYREQRSGLRHFLELAKHLGINVQRLADSGLAFEPIAYPFWQDDPLVSKLAQRMKLCKARINEIDGLIQNTIANIASVKGSIAEAATPDRRQTLDGALQQLNEALEKLSVDLTRAEATHEELCFIRDYISP